MNTHLSSFLDTLHRDLKSTLRGLRSRPGFTLVVALTLALGIGANTAIFSVVHGVLLEPLGYADEDRLVWLSARQPDGREAWGGFSAPDVWYFDENAERLEDVKLWMRQALTLGDPGEVRKVAGAFASVGFFRALGVEAATGRTFAGDDAISGIGTVAVISDEFWQRTWGGDPSIVGRELMIEGDPVTVVGVLPPGLELPAKNVDVWMPVSPVQVPYGRLAREEHDVWALARLAPGATLALADQELDVLAADLAQSFPETNEGWTVDVRPLRDAVVSRARGPILIAFAAGGLVLLVACVNVANLILARSLSREREMAVRRALGAGAARLFQQRVVENLVLALLGGGLGALLAIWLHEGILVLEPGVLPRADRIGLAWPVFAFALSVAFLTGLVFSVAPALRSRKLSAQALRDGGRTAGGDRSRHAARLAMVAAQVSLAVVLLASSVVLISAIRDLESRSPGFDPENLYHAHMILDIDRYDSPRQRAEYYRQMIEEVRRIPGVASAGLSTTSPVPGLGIQIDVPYRAPDGPQLDAPDAPRAAFRVVSPGWFETAGVPLLTGRDISSEDRTGVDRASVVVNRSLARLLSESQDPGAALDRSVEVSLGGTIPGRVVGVVADTRSAGLDLPTRPEIYFAHDQIPFLGMGITVRSAMAPVELDKALSAAVFRIDPSQPYNLLHGLEQKLHEQLDIERFSATLLSLFAFLALLLSAIGIYGVYAYWVRERTREIGVRIALGAQAHRLLLWVLGRGLVLASLGLVAGLGVAIPTASVLARYFQGVEGTQPSSLAFVTATLLVLAAVACFVPALRASRVEPTEALRCE
ncbi:MAG: ABC transporter permease [Thermoanaerobaculia bacterium]|nr:ABC transporter permease [Thermoanaerobaculia bacterium]